MSWKMVCATVAALSVGITGLAVFAQAPQQPSPFDNLLRTKVGKAWQYCTLTEARLDQDRWAVFIEGSGLTAVCNGGWIEVAEKFGMLIAPENPRSNDRWQRALALDQMGQQGWELVGVHRNELDRAVWVFKREK